MYYMKSTSLRLSNLLFLLVLLLAPTLSHASEITVRPFLIDETLAPRDMVENLITLKSDYELRKAVLYATVNEISVDSEGIIKQFVSPVMTDRTNTVTSWIEITRGRIEIPPGETREVPLTIHVDPFAKPGEYHVFIGIVEAINKPAARAIAMNGEADGIIVKITIADQRTDSMKIKSFVIDRFVTGQSKRIIDIELENSGDIASAPIGEIIFYDSRGIEVSSIDVNTEGVSIAPGETININSSIPLDDELGRFKANLSLKYGVDQKASLHDTTFFYLMPLHLLLLLFTGVLIATIFVTFLFRRAFFSHEEDEDFDEVAMYVRDGHEPNPKDHDIDLKNN
jgi:hypothetical protein